MTDLTKNTTPFGLLTPEDQEALKAWSHGVQRYCADGVWRNDQPHFWAPAVAYRAKPAPSVEKRTLHGSPALSYSDYSLRKYKTDTHSLTFDVVDGEPVKGSERWEKLSD